MKPLLFVSLCSAITLSGCALKEDPCENVTVAAEELQQCKILKRQMEQARGNIVIRSELERRYQKDCVELRYYRDAKQDLVCGNKAKVEEKERQRKERLSEQ
ncbi:hypothetical protein [Thalassotalea sp. PLHSN55]|uniref:hypothetical protein n=1 Tax=Thalassotalea sp. PLHSN55 TaxID=3435888 RepID=UPI003F87ED88